MSEECKNFEKRAKGLEKEDPVKAVEGNSKKLEIENRLNEETKIDNDLETNI